MSALHPIISVTGSSGAGTTTVKHTFDQIFRREGIRGASIDGDAFHRYDRDEMAATMAAAEAAGNHHFSHFGPEANLFDELATVFAEYSECGTGRTRHYVHDEAEAERYGSPPGTFSAWEEFEPGSDVLFYEGLHGAVVTDTVDVAQHVDLKIGVVPVVNLEWIQKIERDRSTRGPLPRGRDRHHFAAHARLRPVPLPAVHLDGHQFSTSADRRHLQPFRCALYPHGRRIARGDPLSRPSWHRLPLSRVNDPRQLHDEGELHRHPGRQARPRDAAHPHPNDPSPH